MVSRGYVSVTAVTPAPEPARNLPMCELLPNMDVNIYIYKNRLKINTNILLQVWLTITNLIEFKRYQ